MIKKFLILLLLPLGVIAHGDEVHEDGKQTGGVGTRTYFTAEAASDKYELLLKYGTLDPGKPVTMKLFLSEFNTNIPIDSATLGITVSGSPAIKVAVLKKEKGIYELAMVLPEKKSYNFIVNINGRPGVDLIQLNNVETGKELNVTVNEIHQTSWYNSSWFYGIAGLIAGLILMYFINKTRSRKTITVASLLLCFFPAATSNKASAHGDEDHSGGKASKGGGTSSVFIVEKETQFLFNIQTTKNGSGDFNESSVLFGTVTAAPQGMAVIQSPQTGKIVSLRVSPGQNVGKGQVLAVIEQQVDAGTQISILSQRNTVNAEFEAARAQYERLKAIEDIAAKKDVTEARARYEAARRNRDLFNSNAGGSMGSTKAITLTAPVSGVVGNFNYAIGAVVSGGQTLFDITNLSQVFIEAQLFAADVAKLGAATSFSTVSATDTSIFKLKMISNAQSVNTGNQSQKVLFEIINPNGRFKIGENVNVRITGNNVIKQTLVPNAAITDINGKPAVFIKDKAEQYSISFIVKGQANDLFTVINKGTEDGERVVTANVYQMKMIYLSQ